jgi:murein DD-endopeptidase MepM/ murein hydrolase activator NlpD
MMSLPLRTLAASLAAALVLLAPCPNSHAKASKRHQPASAAAAPVEKGPVTLTPAIVEAGSPELVRVEAPDAGMIDGEWLGHKLQFFRASGRGQGPASKLAWYALAGSDVEAPIGPSKLIITAHIQGTQTQDLSRQIDIRPAHYTTGSLTVAPKFVEPGPDEKAVIDASVQAKQKAFAASDARTPNIPLWSGSFTAPVKAQATASFGTRRMFNGKLASIHKGTDFRAATGTPVLAGNSGIVLLAQPLYYEGNCVMIDHGQGLISISMHLSRIDVKPGQPIAKGQQVGLSGATGRVTGPHLHWAIRWQGAMLDPTKLLKLNLNTLR